MRSENRSRGFLVEATLFYLADCGSATFQTVLRGKKHRDVLFSDFEREANKRGPVKQSEKWMKRTLPLNKTTSLQREIPLRSRASFTV